MNNPSTFIAHLRKSDGTKQSVEEHLFAVAELSKIFARKIGLEVAGELIGLVHDVGKFSDLFQRYLLSAVGELNEDVDDDFIEFENYKGKIDHSTAGAQWIWNSVCEQGTLERVCGQVLAICVASHHSGLIDCIGAANERFGSDVFSKRMLKPDNDTHLNEAIGALPAKIGSRFHELLTDSLLLEPIQERITSIVACSRSSSDRSCVAQTQISLLVRFLFSCLIDADRVDTADFEFPQNKSIRNRGSYQSWPSLIERLENKLSEFRTESDVYRERAKISNACLKKSKAAPGLFSLSVPTGGGKTLSSLRFGLHHAARHKMDRIIYVIPYTSIIDQNAQAVRKILQRRGESVVLEHHSNLTPKKQGHREKVLSENWDAPVVFTTMVQFLESLFGSGTRGARRMHQLANSVIIFDEIQTLPVKCVHLFNNAVNFLVQQCRSTVVLCTATQPLLHRVDPAKGALNLTSASEIVPDTETLYKKLRRVEVIDKQKSGGWLDDEIAELAVEATKESGSCLVIVNTKKSARAIYECLGSESINDAYVPTFHLSTNMCPVHRSLILRVIKIRLAQQLPVVCVSTQLIEAGVDIDFGSAIRCCAGLDSIAQAAGRCNRNGNQQDFGKVYIVNPTNENLNKLPEIQIGKATTLRILDDFNADPTGYGNDLIGPATIKWYFENYFYKRSDEMDFPVAASKIGHDDTVLNLSGLNQLSCDEYVEHNGAWPENYLRQAFMTASKAFNVIDAPTRGVIVPYRQKGKELVRKISTTDSDPERFRLLKRAQRYTVNVFPHTLRKLKEQHAIFQIAPDIEIYCLDAQFYDHQFGLAEEPVSLMEFHSA